MMTPPSSSGAKWLSLHIHPPLQIDRFLVCYLAPFIETQLASRRLKRFFFIRYGNGEDLHIRLRFLPAAGGFAQENVDGLRTLMRKVASDYKAQAIRSTICFEPYDRTIHYFGESVDSVYSELLNEQTSHLALRLLRKTLGNPVAMLCTVGCILLFLFGNSAESSGDAAITASVQLAERILYRSTPAPVIDNGESVTAIATAMRNNRFIIEAALATDNKLRYISRLLARASAVNPKVATHSLHLLCNKVGISPCYEHHLFCGIKILSGESSQ